MSTEARAENAAQRRAAASAGKLVAAAACAVVVAMLAFAAFGARQVEQVAAQAAAAHLDGVRAGAEAAATAEWSRVEDGVQRLAADGEIVQALLDLAQATRDSESDPRIDATLLGAQRAALAAHLEQWYAPLGGQRPVLDDAVGLPAKRRAQWLQAQYVAGAGLVRDGAFAAAHARWHPRLAAAAAEHGMADLLLLRASDGLVVYDVAKTPVFQTSLLDGPFSDSRLGTLFRRTRSTPVAGAVAHADFAPFVPARGQAMAFVTAPLFADGEPVGALVAAFDSAPLDRALTARGGWQALGLGDEGDVFLIGGDGTLRSTPRQPPSGNPLPRFPTPAVLSGGEAGSLEYAVAGRPMLASIGAPLFGDLGWRVVATRSAADAQRDAAAARRALFVAALVIALLLSGALAVLVWWGTTPLQHLAGAMARLRLNDPRARVPVLGTGEAAAIALQVNGLLEQHRDERAAARQQLEREMRALAAAVDGWQPAETSPRLPTASDLAPIVTALSRLADRLDDVRRAARAIPPPAAEALRAAAERLRRDAERNLEALGAAEEATRHAGQRLERAVALAEHLLAGSRDAEDAARAEQATLRQLAAALEQAGAEAVDERATGGRALLALGSGAAAAAALVDELSVLAVNAALPGADGDDALAESARIAVERAEQVGTELDHTLAGARAALEARATAMPAPAEALGAVERQLGGLLEILDRTRRGVGDLDGQLRPHGDGEVESAVRVAVESARRLRQTAELVASEAAAVAAAPSDRGGD